MANLAYLIFAFLVMLIHARHVEGFSKSPYFARHFALWFFLLILRKTFPYDTPAETLGGRALIVGSVLIQWTTRVAFLFWPCTHGGRPTAFLAFLIFFPDARSFFSRPPVMELQPWHMELQPAMEKLELGAGVCWWSLAAVDEAAPLLFLHPDEGKCYNPRFFCYHHIYFAGTIIIICYHRVLGLLDVGTMLNFVISASTSVLFCWNQLHFLLPPEFLVC